MTARRPHVYFEVFSTGPDCTLCQRTVADLMELTARLADRVDMDLEVHELHDGVHAIPSDYVFRAPVVHLNGSLVAEGRIDPLELANVVAVVASNGDFG